MSSNRPCQRTRLATGPHVTIEACSCSMIHLNLGAVTVRFTPEAFEGLGAMVSTAIGEMNAGSLHGDGDRALTVHDMSRRVRGEA